MEFTTIEHDTARRLPIEDILGEVHTVLERQATAVIIAPPGAGKTTRLPLSLIDCHWVENRRLIVVEPRRLAARMAARRMATQLGESVGERVGYTVRMDRRTSNRTRLELVTAGVFVRMIMDDPDLPGVAGVLFDEAHERSLDMDLGLALACDVQTGLRNDLRLVIMSATLDGEAYSQLLGGTPVLESKGRQYPIEVRYLGRNSGKARRGRSATAIDQSMTSAIRMSLDRDVGSILAFLPGQSEIRRTAERLSSDVASNTDIAPLYGTLSGSEQDLAVQPAVAGRRKVVLATSIAETSLTIEGVRIVIDCGLQRRPVYDPGTGLSRLETVRVSQASADQRRGRAGRTEPGICYRLWDEAETKALPAFDRPEILESELSGLALALLSWGVSDPGDLTWRDPPPPAAFAEAIDLLDRLGARNTHGHLTEHGRAISKLPLAPRLGHMLMTGSAEGRTILAARLAALLSEPGLAGRNIDLNDRLMHFGNASGGHTERAKAMAKRWANIVTEDHGPYDGEYLHTDAVGTLVAAAYPDRVAQARGAAGHFKMANGRGAWLAEEEALASAKFLAIADVQGGGPDARITAAAPLSRSAIEDTFQGQIEDCQELTYRGETDTIVARHMKRLGALVLSDVGVPLKPGPETDAILAKAVLDRGLAALPWPEELRRIRSRLSFASTIQDTERDFASDLTLSAEEKLWPDLSDEQLLHSAEDWLPILVAGKTSLGAIQESDLSAALSVFLPFDVLRRLDEEVPDSFLAPSGRNLNIDYSGGNPTVRAMPQALFGLTMHPNLGRSSIPLVFELLSPAQRPIQITRDLPGFWRGSWRDIRADMRGRYPKHAWPEDPTKAEAFSGVRPRD